MIGIANWIEIDCASCRCGTAKKFRMVQAKRSTERTICSPNRFACRRRGRVHGFSTTETRATLAA